MLVIKVNNGKLEQAIKSYRSKIIKTRQMTELQDRKEYEKPSVKKRERKKKAIYVQKKFKNKD